MVKRTPLIALLLITAGASATDFEGLRQCSSAKVKALKVFHVGQAALYRQDCGADDKLAPPLRLAFGYNREVPGDAFAKAARKMIERNLTEARFQSLSRRIDAFNRHYRTTSDGDRYTLDYDSDQSLVLRLNGEELARERGRDFADAYLSIWFGENPYSDNLKAELLSGGS
ncbi:chalcone isomerase family protein [Alloalcanivorax sp. C16-2]|uniref:chalcone isomerase family protein n=1 Tax=Alloalcanivorax TaxID=3020832 RepID=UPI0019342571|nr:chalcone isomerase family protein [Alloalcanivorax marinus]MBL7251289.1 chalcone isomerase family protein [Alloalcanivorax marinus]